MNNALRNCDSDKRLRRLWPAHMPIRDGTTARKEASPKSADSREFVPSAKAKATVDAVNNIPMA